MREIDKKFIKTFLSTTFENAMDNAVQIRLLKAENYMKNEEFEEAKKMYHEIDTINSTKADMLKMLNDTLFVESNS